MRKFAYITGFSIVGLSSLLFISVWVLERSGIRVYFLMGFFHLVEFFAHPLPVMLRHKLPYYYYVSMALDIALAILILRRLWLMARTRSISPPPSYLGWLHFLMLVGLGCVALVLVGIILWFIHRIPSITLVLLPAAFLLPPTVTLVELLSLFKRNPGVKKPGAVEGVPA